MDGSACGGHTVVTTMIGIEERLVGREQLEEVGRRDKLLDVSKAVANE